MARVAPEKIASDNPANIFFGDSYGGYVNTKHCKYCGEIFTPTHHYQTLCSIECRLEADRISKRKYRMQNADKLNAAKREINRKCMSQYRQNHFLAYKLKTAKSSAKRRGLEFNLQLSDLTIPKLCPLLEIPIVQEGGTTPNTASIDRIDSQLGYISGNVQVISYKANTMKSNATREELITFAKNILKMYGEI